jgi:hypothetical protein
MHHAGVSVFFVKIPLIENGELAAGTKNSPSSKTTNHLSKCEAAAIYVLNYNEMP